MKKKLLRIIWSLRWVALACISALLFLLLIYKSKDPVLFLRYSSYHFILIIGIFVFILSYWRVLLSKKKSYRVFSQIVNSRLLLILILTVSFVVILSLFYLAGDKKALSLVVYRLLSYLIFIPFGFAVLIWALSDAKYYSYAKNGALVLFSCCLTLIFLECFFQAFLFKNKIPETTTEFKRIISTNWPKDIPLKKPANSFRIMGLADSFGESGGHDNFHYLLENSLQSHGYNLDMVNISKGEYEPVDELKIFQRFGKRYMPDLVIHSMFVGNDLLENSFILSQGELKTYNGISVRLKKGWSRFYPHNWLLFIWIKRFYLFTKDKRLIEEETEQHLTNANETLSVQEKEVLDPGTFSKKAFLEIERQRLYKCARLNIPPPKRWYELTKILDRIKNEVNSIGAQYMILIHPDQFQVEEGLRKQLASAYAINFERFDLNLPQDFLLEYCDSRKIACIDLLPSFIKNGRNGGLFKLRDTHYNQRGNQLAAEQLYYFLTSGKIFK